MQRRFRIRCRFTPCVECPPFRKRLPLLLVEHDLAARDHARRLIDDQRRLTPAGRGERDGIRAKQRRFPTPRGNGARRVNEAQCDAALLGESLDVVPNHSAIVGIGDGEGPDPASARGFRKWYKADFNRRVFASLKPGGVYFILDHEANAGTTMEQIAKLHRIEKAQVIREVTAAGFRLAGEGEFLNRAGDDHTKGIFDPAIRGKTDQYALKFVKP